MMPQGSAPLRCVSSQGAFGVPGYGGYDNEMPHMAHPVDLATALEVPRCEQLGPPDMKNFCFFFGIKAEVWKAMADFAETDTGL